MSLKNEKDKHDKQDKHDIGYIYCITNPSMPGVVKIGMTRRTPEERLADANRDTWNHTKFELAFAKQVRHPEQKEKTMHKILEQHGQRKTASREFFTISVGLARLYFDLVEEYTEVVPGEIASQSAVKKERKPRKKKEKAEEHAITAVTAVEAAAATAASAAEAVRDDHPIIDIHTLFSNSLHDINGWPPVQHLSRNTSYLLLSFAFERRLLRMLVCGTVYTFEELHLVEANALRRCMFELLDNNGVTVEENRSAEMMDRLYKLECVTLCACEA